MQADVLKGFSGSADGVFAVDMKQRIVFLNATAERMVGYKAEELIGKRCYRVFGGVAEDESRICGRGCPVIHEARQGKVAAACNMSVRTTSGESRWWGVTHVLLPGGGKRLSLVVHVFHDATEEVEAKQLVHTLSGALSRATRALTRPRGPAAESAAGLPSLSSRELEVLNLMGKGLTTRAIAEQLSLSPNTVRTHTQRILDALGVHSRLEAVAAVRHLGLAQP
ncbi:MAG: PAS domain S-box protein [Chloroflexi bacterium]|nr:PAS domain S-box protein [Chloroflexota bacterium]